MPALSDLQAAERKLKDQLAKVRAAKRGEGQKKRAADKKTPKGKTGIHRKSQPVADPGEDPDYIPPPAELSGDVARQVWRETEPALRDRLSIMNIDRRTLMLYCDTWQLLADCSQVLQDEGRYITMPDTGYVSRHPAAVDAAKAVSQIRQLGAELGMSPKSRRGVKVRSSEGDPLKDFLANKPGSKRRG